MTAVYLTLNLLMSAVMLRDAHRAARTEHAPVLVPMCLALAASGLAFAAKYGYALLGHTVPAALDTTATVLSVVTVTAMLFAAARAAELVAAAWKGRTR